MCNLSEDLARDRLEPKTKIHIADWDKPLMITMIYLLTHEVYTPSLMLKLHALGN